MYKLELGEIYVLETLLLQAAYRQCMREGNETVAAVITTAATVLSSSTKSSVEFVVVNETIGNVTKTLTRIENFTGIWECREPSSYVGENVMTNLWRVVYWTSQCLTWLILPMMQSYTQAGDFTVKGKLKSSLLDNAIYYGSYLFICGILLAYVAVKPELQLDWQKLKAIASSASNTWGLFLLVFMLGYGLVSVPRSLWLSSCRGHSLNNAYFKIATLSNERNSAEEALDDVLETLWWCIKTLPTSSVLYGFVDTIQSELPTEFRERMTRRRVETSSLSHIDEKLLVKLHKQVKRAVQNYHRTEKQWADHILTTIHLEDIERNIRSREFVFKSSLYPVNQNHWIFNIICSPTIQWYWRCWLCGWSLKLISVCAGIMSVVVIWSEVTFFQQSPALSLFAVFLKLAKNDYVLMETLSTLTIAYLAICAFYTVFKIRVFNFYYLANSHQTDEYSLIFAGMLLCRLTPPLSLNYLGLIHMDSHIIAERILETSYTQVMGHMDVLSLISDGFNIYFPMGILLISLLTWFKVGSRILSTLGFHQFLVDDDVTTDLVTDGQQLLAREKRRRQRNTENAERRKNFQDRSFSSNSRQAATLAAHQANENVENLRNLSNRDESESDIVGPGSALHFHQQVIYGSPESTSVNRSATASGNRLYQPPRDLFDDV